MPICMVEQDGRSGPRVLCDVCMEVIVSADDGNYEWFPHQEASKSHIPVPVCFTHKRCSDQFERTQSPLHKGDYPSNMELRCFPIYLGNALRLDWDKAKQHAFDMSDL